MIYIIFNESYEWDDFIPTNDRIEYISTDKEQAVKYFEDKFGNVLNWDDSKYHYVYQLYEFPDGWNSISDYNGKTINILMTADNCPESDE